MQQNLDSNFVFDNSFVRLFLIFLGYSSVVLPFYYFINFVNRKCKGKQFIFIKSDLWEILKIFSGNFRKNFLVEIFDFLNILLSPTHVFF